MTAGDEKGVNVTSDNQKKVLIVDDEPDICVLLSRNLKRRGFDASFATTLTDGLAKFTATKPDFLILDHNLPDGYGLDNLETFRGLNPTVKIIAISAMGHLKEKADSAGADLFMSKPLSFRDIEEFMSR